jgi:hypothetical protein
MVRGTSPSPRPAIAARPQVPLGADRPTPDPGAAPMSPAAGSNGPASPRRPEALDRHLARTHATSHASKHMRSSRRRVSIATLAPMDPGFPGRVATRIHGIHETHGRPTGRCCRSVGRNTNISACTSARRGVRTPRTHRRRLCGARNTGVFLVRYMRYMRRMGGPWADGDRFTYLSPPNSSPAPMGRTKHRCVSRALHAPHAPHGRSSGGRRPPVGPRGPVRAAGGGRVGRAEPAELPS